MNIISSNSILNQLCQWSPESYDFEGLLLPEAIGNEAVTVDELIDFWKFWQHFGDDRNILAQAFFNGSCPKSRRLPQNIDEIVPLIKRLHTICELIIQMKK